ncbi:hypothetical protein AN403_4226 [Pseudomonas fluorescens]|uniref:Uncharacterized protein n=1 Tax=Pseudomonas fluorescens TaxID=294 RepID=A0A0P8ZT61_PSEFL|nr:hypothetical protein AN403_4226 [Pseudomonas fluorescens]
MNMGAHHRADQTLNVASLMFFSNITMLNFDAESFEISLQHFGAKFRRVVCMYDIRNAIHWPNVFVQSQACQHVGFREDDVLDQHRYRDPVWWEQGEVEAHDGARMDANGKAHPRTIDHLAVILVYNDQIYTCVVDLNPFQRTRCNFVAWPCFEDISRLGFAQAHLRQEAFTLSPQPSSHSMIAGPFQPPFICEYISCNPNLLDRCCFSPIGAYRIHNQLFHLSTKLQRRISSPWGASRHRA